MIRLHQCAVVLVALFCFLFAVAQGGVPQQLTVQGRLTDASDNPVTDGVYPITVSIWDAPVGGAMLSSSTQNVQVTNGLFAISVSVVASTISTISPPYIQYQVGGDPPISPRTAMSSSPYAMVSSRVSGDIETQPAGLTVRRGSISAANFRVGGDAGESALQVEAKTDTTKLRIVPTGGGDPDFDLLRISGMSGGGAGTSTHAAEVAITGDPDFDLLRISADADSAKIRMSAQSTGDPDFDLLRIVGGATSTGHGASMSITGDPDFDLLRISGGMDATAPGASLSMTGDPDFDLLRISAGADSANIRISGQIPGDPDFDLLRIVGGTGSTTSGAAMTITGDPDFDLLRISADADSAKIRMGGQITGDPDFDLLRIVGGSGKSQLSMQSEPSGAASASHSMDVTCDSSSTELRLRVIPTGQTVGRSTTRVDDYSARLTIATGDETGGGIELLADNTGRYATVGSTFYLDATRSSDDEVIKTFSWKQLGGPYVTRMQMRADSLSSSMMCRGLLGKDVLLLSDQSGANIRIEDAMDNVMMEMHGDGRLGVGKPADNVKRIDVAGGAFCNGTNWVNASDVNSKENFADVDAQLLLDKLAQLDIAEWNYRGEDQQVRHIGPTAQDFYRLFGLGIDDKSISTIDPAGVSLVAIKELYRKSKEVDTLKQELQELKSQLQQLQKSLENR